MAGDRETGVAIMRLTAGLDEGPVALMEAEPIAPDDDYGTLAGRLRTLGARLLIRALDERPPFAEQPAEGVTYAEKITAEDRTLDPARAGRGERAHRPRAASARRGAHRPRRRQLPRGAPRPRGDDGTLEPLEVQPPGGRPMPYADYLRGHGERFRSA